MEIRDLAIVGDRRTAAIVARDGSVVWYCPGRFDRASLFASLLDSDNGGAWTLEAPALEPHSREYVDDSAVLRTRLRVSGGTTTVSDWMPLGDDLPCGLCRRFDTLAVDVAMVVHPRPDYGREGASIKPSGSGVCINGRWWLYASVKPQIDGATVRLRFAAGSDGWAALLDSPCDTLATADIDRWHVATLDAWAGIGSQITYRGPFETQVAQSLRALRLLTHQDLGGIIAAATTSLPEVPGGERNYDYRYVWMRDASMIVSALVRAGSTGPDERRFLGFICDSRQDVEDAPLLPPFLSLDAEPADPVSCLDLAGYRRSRPVRIGNDANDQLQLDGFANVLLVAKLIYARHDTREHWGTVQRVADFLADNWHRPDYGIWEEHEERQYTSSKAVASCGLKYIAEHAENKQQATRWRDAAKAIDAFIESRCMTADGAYAVYAGSQAVDVSAALLPSWGYCDADSPQMRATIAALEQRYCRGQLYWRHLEELPVFREGAFLAGTLWVAQYWVLRGDLQRARSMLENVLRYANDVGLFAEEADDCTGAMLGNFPQTFVHASFIGAVVDYRDALEKQGAPT